MAPLTVEAHLLLSEKLFEVVAVLFYFGLAVPSIAWFFGDFLIVEEVVGCDEDLDVGVRAMLFDNFCKFLNTIEQNLDIYGVVEGLFHLSGVMVDISGGKIFVRVDDVDEYFEWQTMAETVDLFVNCCEQIIFDG